MRVDFSESKTVHEPQTSGGPNRKTALKWFPNRTANIVQRRGCSCGPVCTALARETTFFYRMFKKTSSFSLETIYGNAVFRSAILCGLSLFSFICRISTIQVSPFRPSAFQQHFRAATSIKTSWSHSERSIRKFICTLFQWSERPVHNPAMRRQQHRFGAVCTLYTQFCWRYYTPNNHWEKSVVVAISKANLIDANGSYRRPNWSF